MHGMTDYFIDARQNENKTLPNNLFGFYEGVKGHLGIFIGFCLCAHPTITMCEHLRDTVIYHPI